MSYQADLPTIFVGETKNITFDFTSQLASGETISTKVVAATVYSGTDTTPSDMISGAATNSGAVVTQLIVSQTLGVIYRLLCTITTSAGQTLEQFGYVAVVPGAA